MRQPRRTSSLLSDPGLRRPPGSPRSRFEAKVLARSSSLPSADATLPRISEDRLSLEYLAGHEALLDTPFLITSPEDDTNSLTGTILPDCSMEEIVAEIGAGTEVRLIDVDSQSELAGHTLADFAEYISKRTPEHKVLNLISLEISSSQLSTRVQSPELVRQVDWIDTVWPLSRRARGDFPQVQKYCIISMEGAYTDFHVDFGGTSVWYHVIRGGKRFFLVPPSEDNLAKFAAWMCTGDQSQAFFGDLVRQGQCQQLELSPGSTLVIPAGWIHAVYTPQDTVVFGGNFLHFFSVVKQLQVYVMEQRIHVLRTYRLPLFRQIHMYALCEALRVFESSVSETLDESDLSIAMALRCSRVLHQIPYLLHMCMLWSKSQVARMH